MKEQIKNAYRPAPPRFHAAVASAIDEAQVTAPAKKHITKPVRIIVAAVLILAIVPTAVFGATKLFGLFAQPVDKYGVELSMETTNKDYPAYVKMQVDIPEGKALRGVEGAAPYTIEGAAHTIH